MDITIADRRNELNAPMHSFVCRHLTLLEGRHRDLDTIRVVFDRQRHRILAHVHLCRRGQVFEGIASTGSAASSFRMALDKVLHQLKKHDDRRRTRRRGHKTTWRS